MLLKWLFNNTEIVMFPSIEEDDIKKQVKTRADEKASVHRFPLRNTLKEMVRKLRASVPLTKLAQADTALPEYLLYLIIDYIR